MYARFTPAAFALVILSVYPNHSFGAPNTDIFTAAWAGDIPQASALLDADPSLVNARTAAGETPLHSAVAGRHSAMVTYLLGRGADPTLADDREITPLHWAATTEDAALIDALINSGAGVNAADTDGNRPLHYAARRFRMESVQALIAAGAEVNARNLAGQTPLHALGAAGRPDVDVAEYQDLLDAIAQVLISAGADATLSDDAGQPAWPHAPAEGGGPREPSGYPTYDSIATQLQTRATQYPNICQRVDLGTSSTTQHIYALKISDNVGVEEDEPEFKWVSTMHGNETSGVVMCLDLIDYLLTNYGTDPRVTNIVNSMEIWIVPCMNPYGYANNTRYNANGYDLNRSFPEGSGPSPEPNPNPSTGRQPEVATIINWTFAHSFTLSANLHEGTLVANYPYDNDNMGSVFSPSPDEDLFVYISEQYSYYNSPMWNSTSFTHGITNGAEWYAINGGMQDWHYRYMGCNEITIEISNTQSPPYSQMPTYWSQNRDSMLAYMETCLIGVRGVVIDGATCTPLAATVTVAGNAHAVYTDPEVGDYHRMLLAGTYTLTFTATGYPPVTVPNVVVGSGAATRVDVPMWGPLAVTYPNGGETLATNAPINVTWSGSPAARYQAQYSSNYGQTFATTDDFERTTLGSDYTTGGNLPWTTTTSPPSPHAGSRSARAGAITDSQSSWMTRPVSSGQLSFWYKVSSEQNFDFFNFYIDDLRQLHKSGSLTWTQYSTTLGAGSHVLKWEYSKDPQTKGGYDTVLIDDLSVTVDATSWTDIIALTSPGAMSTPWTPLAPSSTYKVRIRPYACGNYGPWDESNATFTVTPGQTCLPQDLDGDINQDGLTDGRDVRAIADALLGTPTQAQICHGDYSGNNQLDPADIPGFVNALLGP